MRGVGLRERERERERGGPVPFVSEPPIIGVCVCVGWDVKIVVMVVTASMETA
jgi:hypothetical protein